MTMIDWRRVSSDDQHSDLCTVRVFNRFNAYMTVSEKYDAFIDVNERTALEILPKKKRSEKGGVQSFW